MIGKKIDMHMHCSDIAEFSNEKEVHFATPEDVRAIYDKIGVEKGVLMSSGAIPECAMNNISTRETRAMVERNRNTIGWWFCPVDPRNIRNSPDTDFTPLLEHYKAQGARGISEMTANLYLDDPKMLNLFKYCEKCRLPVTLHFGVMGRGYGVVDDLHLPRLEKVLGLFPDLVILGHSMAFWAEIGTDATEENRQGYLMGPISESGVLIELMSRHKNLYADLSAYSAYSALMRDVDFTYRFMEEFQDQIVYATDIATSNWIDMPQAGLSGFLDEAVEKGHISQKTYNKICRGNALRLLKETI